MLAVPTVLSHLATRFSVHPENIATEALAFILETNEISRGAMCKYLSHFEQALSDLTFRTQATNDGGSRPDLLGRDSAGCDRLTIEAKFWAGLTEAQPCGYLRHMPTDGLLLFITPAARVDTVWAELLRRVQGDGFHPAPARSVASDVRYTKLDRQTLAIASWRAIIGSLLTTADAAANLSASSDLRQLASLCEQMDSDAFLPLRSEETTSTIGRRIVEFGELAIDVSERLVDKQLATVKGMRKTAGNGWYGRYFLLNKYGCLISHSSERWAKWGESALWLDVKGPDWKFSNAVKFALEVAGIPFRISADGCLVPLFLLTNVERDAVLDHIVAQVERVASVLPVLGEQVIVPPPDDISIDDSVDVKAG